MSDRSDIDVSDASSNDVLEDKEGVLIEAVRTYPILWNLSRGDYKDGMKKALAWSKIAKIMFGSDKGDNIKNVSDHWRKIRRRYTSIRNSISPKSGAGADDKIDSRIAKWDNYRVLDSFLRKCVSRKTKTASNSLPLKSSQESVGGFSDLEADKSSQSWDPLKTLLIDSQEAGPSGGKQNSKPSEGFPSASKTTKSKRRQEENSLESFVPKKLSKPSEKIHPPESPEKDMLLTSAIETLKSLASADPQSPMTPKKAFAQSVYHQVLNIGKQLSPKSYLKFKTQVNRSMESLEEQFLCY